MQVDTASASQSQQHHRDASVVQLNEQLLHIIQSDDAKGFVDIVTCHYQQAADAIHEKMVEAREIGVEHDRGLIYCYALAADKATNLLVHFFTNNYKACIGAPRIMAAGLRLVPWSDIGVQNHTDLIRLYNHPGTRPPEWLSCLAQLLQTGLYEADVLDSAGYTLCARALLMGDVRLFEAAFQAVEHPRPMAELQQLLDLSRKRPNTAVAHTLLCHYPSLAMCYRPALVYPYTLLACKHVTQYLQVAGSRYLESCTCGQTSMAFEWCPSQPPTRPISAYKQPAVSYCRSCLRLLIEEDRITAPLKRDLYMAVVPADVQQLIMGYVINCDVHTVKIY